MYSFLSKEGGYDGYHSNHENKYRVEEIWNKSGLVQQKAAATGFLLPHLTEAYPEIRTGTSFVKPEGIDFVSYGDARFTTDKFIRADSLFFTFFTFDLIYGDPITALNGNKKVVITESIAKIIFGDSLPVGKMLTRARTEWEVTGVIKDMPDNSHFHFDYIFTNSFISSDFQANNMFYTYVEVPDAVDVKELEQKISKGLHNAYGYDTKLKGSNSCEVIFKPLAAKTRDRIPAI